ncbi:MAG: hypothetical protein ACRYFR_13155 [Janthinobacterium lividum]
MSPTDPTPDPHTEPPVPVQGDGVPDYSHLEIHTESDLPTPTKPGGSATEPESGGGYSG